MIVKELNKTQFEKLFNKSQNEILQILIQAQIDELEKSNDPDFDKLDELQKQLIALENQKQANNKILITAEKSETAVKVDKDNKENDLIDDIDETNQKLDELRGILLSNSKIKDNQKIKILRGMFDAVDKNESQEKIRAKLEKIIAFLQKA
ncbi:hypothetical protein [uncultured Gammaproteobacteria bacterium]|nr:hypothetical protein [uncultured Gammaproteobacteria bacterium]